MVGPKPVTAGGVTLSAMGDRITSELIRSAPPPTLLSSLTLFSAVRTGYFEKKTLIETFGRLGFTYKMTKHSSTWIGGSVQGPYLPIAFAGSDAETAKECVNPLS